MKMKGIILAIIAACSAFPAFAADVPAGSTKAERNLIVRGNEQFNDSNYHEALQLYEQALALNPNSVYGLYNKAVVLTHLASEDNKGTENDPRKQASEIFQSISQNKNYPELAANSAYNLGNMAFNDNQFDQAINCYKQSLRLRPDNVKAKQNLLLALQRKEEQQQEQPQQQQQQEQQQEQQQQQQQQQQQPEPEPQASQNAQQMMQAVQNKENATRRNQRVVPGTPYTDKPW